MADPVQPLRVVQWGTGNIGTRSLRAVIEHPGLELVGLYVHSAGKAGRDAWTSVDDLVLRKIAQAGFSGLTSMVKGTSPDTSPPVAPAPGKTEPAVAEAEPAPAPGNDSITALGYTDH